MKDNVRSTTNDVLVHQARRRQEQKEAEACEAFREALLKTAVLVIFCVSLFASCAWQFGWFGSATPYMGSMDQANGVWPEGETR